MTKKVTPFLSEKRKVKKQSSTLVNPNVLWLPFSVSLKLYINELEMKFAEKVKKYMPGRKFLKTIFILLILEYLGKAVIYLIMKM